MTRFKLNRAMSKTTMTEFILNKTMFKITMASFNSTAVLLLRHDLPQRLPVGGYKFPRVHHPLTRLIKSFIATSRNLTVVALKLN